MSRKEIQRALFGKAARGRPGPEASVLRDVLQFLNLVPECWAWRQNTGGMAARNLDGSSRFIRFGSPGMSDVSGILRGFRLEVEVKAPGKFPTPVQFAWLDRVNRYDGVAFWCASLDACIINLKIEYKKRGWLWRM